MDQQIFLDLSPEMQRQLPRSLRDLLAGQGVTLPPGVELAEGPMPESDENVSDKDFGIVISLTLDPATIAALAGALTSVILAISQFLKDRAHEPKVIEVDDVLEFIAPDGTVKRRLAKKAILIEPGPQLKVELEARLAKGNNAAIRFKLED